MAVFLDDVNLIEDVKTLNIPIIHNRASQATIEKFANVA